MVGTILGYFECIRSAAVYAEAVRQVETPKTLVVRVLFFGERERVEAIWPGRAILLAGFLILVYTP